MADASKIKRCLGTPPAPDEARTDLVPEPVPAAAEPIPRPVADTGVQRGASMQGLYAAPGTVHFATKVTRAPRKPIDKPTACNKAAQQRPDEPAGGRHITHGNRAQRLDSPAQCHGRICACRLGRRRQRRFARGLYAG
jgi:hypothetical protein